MDNEHGLSDDKFNNFDWTRWHYEGKHFEARAVSRGEFEALKRFGDYEKLCDGTLNADRRREGVPHLPRGRGGMPVWADNTGLVYHAFRGV